MRKFISVVAALLMIFAVSANAQTVRSSRMFENMSITVDGGVVSPIKPVDQTFFENLRGTAGIEIDKYFTPVVGIGAEGIAFFNTTGVYTAVDQTAVLVNGKINISNWFGGYKGQPRRVEVVGFGGIGWGHNFTDEVQVKNYSVYDAGAELNFNVGKQRAWQINIRPSVLWNTTAPYPKLSRKEATLRIAAGLTYKFGSKSKKSHNFVVCPYAVTQADYDALKFQYDALVAKGPEIKEVVKEKEVIKEVPVETTKTVVAPLNVTFAMGSTKLTAVEKAKIDEFVQSTGVREVIVVGSADKGTGTVARNEYLAKERASVVAKYLNNKGIITKTESTMDAVSASAEASRAAIVEIK